MSDLPDVDRGFRLEPVGGYRGAGIHAFAVSHRAGSPGDDTLTSGESLLGWFECREGMRDPLTIFHLIREL